MLFARLGNPVVAGNFAGELFAAQTWIALGCGLVLLVHARAGAGASIDGPARTTISLTVIALLLALLQQYAVAPHILARENLRLWHGLGSGMYLGQWVCAGILLWRMGRRTA
ncbi:DUF4149 domain-containing protein [Variovorax sp. PBL-E5]|uniref:DUF4149 domain-containing protein n=1 Tax=Variovorax sp. PBL-E5 TaxID=434014 RepID=UPI001316A749|nr:DUF4149 domain-containing protein [Variovorax sp. PBL-E5]VTU27827.1 hypothetical protein E5CHR_02484 [Variovorax sp. PBL-E5]